MANTPSSPPGSDDLLKPIKDLSEKLWLAGIGAFVTVQRKGGELLTTLIEEGREFEVRLGSSASDKPAPALPKKQLTPEQLEQLEMLFQERVARALRHLQVPTRQEVEALHRRLDDLSASIRLLGKELGD